MNRLVFIRRPATLGGRTLMNATFLFARTLARHGLAVLGFLLLLAASGAAGNPDLERLETAHAKEVSEKLDAPFLAGLQRLNDSYRVTLDTALKKAIAQGELDDTLAYQTELKRFTAENNVPDQDAPGINGNVAKLRVS